MPSNPISQHPRLKLIGASPIARSETPRLPPSHVSQRGPHSHQAEKSGTGPHRKTLNFAAVRRKRTNGSFNHYAGLVRKESRGDHGSDPTRKAD
jgi:hypothetical protein